jgi:aryl-alcohol dehydrogenase-like predicted oxidoreductase
MRVSELCQGTMTFGETWGWGASKEESGRIFDTFVAAGGNIIDTANNFTKARANSTSASWSPPRERFVVASIYTLTTRRDDPNGGGNSRKNLVQSLEASLKRLRTDYLDLL